MQSNISMLLRVCSNFRHFDLLCFRFVWNPYLSKARVGWMDLGLIVIVRSCVSSDGLIGCITGISTPQSVRYLPTPPGALQTMQHHLNPYSRYVECIDCYTTQGMGPLLQGKQKKERVPFLLGIISFFLLVLN